MIIWVLLGLMFLLAVGFILVPARRTIFVSVVIATGLISFGLYAMIGSPSLITTESAQLYMEDMVQSLALRLQEQPEDLDGWIMLGRSYMTLGDYDQSANAFEQALVLAPQDPTSLYWSGIGAANQRQFQTAVDRWERLRMSRPGPEVIQMLDEGIADWRRAGGIAAPQATTK